MKAPLFILSGPSGSGKSTVISRLLAEPDPPLRQSVSATTRHRRPTEREGVHYHFWTPERFQAAMKGGELLESAEVFGNWYGTPRSEVEPYRQKGIGVILAIDVQGAEQVRRKCSDVVTIFLRTSSLEVYERRLRARGTETEETIQRRLQGARRELERAGEYQYVIVNDILDTAVAELRQIVRSHFEGRDHAG
jgi:guanylate kinase